MKLTIVVGHQYQGFNLTIELRSKKHTHKRPIYRFSEEISEALLVGLFLLVKKAVMTINKARKILGKKAKDLTDAEIKRELETAIFLTELVFKNLPISAKGVISK